MLVIGFDFGTKKMGVALGQTLLDSARPLPRLPCVKNQPKWSAIKKLIQQWQPDAFIVGIPVHMDGTQSTMTVKARQFTKALQERYNLPVYEVDERLTTVTAKQIISERDLADKISADSIAAVLIVEQWMKEHHDDLN